MMRVVCSYCFMLLVLLTVSSVEAHGGGDLIAGPEPVGPYIVSVWVNPPDPRATEMIHFTVGLASPEDRQPVLDAQIMVEMRPVGSGTLMAYAPATTEQSTNRLFYETDIMVEDATTYDTTFVINGPDGEGSLTVPVEVNQPSNINWNAIAVIGVAAIVLIGWWRSRRIKKTPQKR